MFFSKSRFLGCIALVGLLTFAGCQGDDFTTVDVQGRATFPPEFRSSLGLLDPVRNSPLQVVDLGRAGEITAVSSTDDDGNYFVTIPPTVSAAVIVFGEVRVSGLVDVRFGSKTKSFDGITDVACEAGVTAVVEGAITSVELDEERINNFEAGARAYLAANSLNFADPAAVTAAAQAVRVLTDDGAHGPR